jgi:hypothetical protein
LFVVLGVAEIDGSPLGVADGIAEGTTSEGARLGEIEMVGLALLAFLNFNIRPVPSAFFAFFPPFSFLLVVLGAAEIDGSPLGVADGIAEGTTSEGARLGEIEMVGLALFAFLNFNLRPPFPAFPPFAFLLVVGEKLDEGEADTDGSALGTAEIDGSPLGVAEGARLGESEMVGDSEMIGLAVPFPPFEPFEPFLLLFADGAWASA